MVQLQDQELHLQGGKLRQIKDNVWINPEQVVSVKMAYDEKIYSYAVRKYVHDKEQFDTWGGDKPRVPLQHDCLSPRITMSDGTYYNFSKETLENVVRLVD